MALILRRARIGWNQDDYDVLEDDAIVGRIFKVPIAPEDRPWMWAGLDPAIHRLETTLLFSDGYAGQTP